MSRMGKKVKGLLKLVVSFGILYILFSQLDWQQARGVVARADPLLLVPPLLVLVLDRIWMAWKWNLLLAVVAPPPSFYEAVRVYYVSSFQGNALPLGGLGPDLIRYAHLRSSRIGSDAVAVSIVMERIVGLLATVLTAVAASMILIGKVGGGGETTRFIQWVLLGGLGGAAFLTSLLFSRRLQRFIYHRLSRIEFLSGHETYQKILKALKKYRDVPGVLFVNLILSITEQLFMVVVFFLGALAFQVPVGFLDCLAVIPFSELLRRLPISYAGLGIREGVQVFFFGLLGVAYPDILVLSSAVFLLYLVSVLPGGAWSLTRSGIEPAKV